MTREDLLDLNDVLQYPGRQAAVDVTTELPDEPDLDLIEPLQGFIEAVSTGSMLLITGEFKTKVVLPCSRCHEDLELEIAFEIDEQFSVEGVPSSLTSQDYARVVADEPYPLFQENSLMVEALLRQMLLLAFPLQPLCSGSWDIPCPTDSGRAVPAGSLRDNFGALAALRQKAELAQEEKPE